MVRSDCADAAHVMGIDSRTGTPEPTVREQKQMIGQLVQMQIEGQQMQIEAQQMQIQMHLGQMQMRAMQSMPN